jgi:uncharacterized membrane protein
MPQSKTQEHLALERMVFFSDAVFAIAITLLVIEIRVPALESGATDSTLILALFQILPKMIGFLVSFLLIGQTWIEHHRICLLIGGFRLGLLWKNLLLLLFVAFLPFATAVMSEYYYLNTAICFYAISFAALGLAKASFWRYAVKKKLLANGVETRQIQRIGRRVWATPIVCGAVTIAAGVVIPYSYFGFMFIPLIAFLLDRTASKKKRSIS